MYTVTTQQSRAITQALTEAEQKISTILKQPCGVLLTEPRLTINDDALAHYVSQVMAVVCKHTGVSTTDILSRNRSVGVTRARYIAMRLVRQSPYRPTLSKTAKVFNRDHATVIHATTALQNELDTNETIKQLFQSIQADLI